MLDGITSNHTLYYILAGTAFGCMAALIVLACVFGLRVHLCVKREMLPRPPEHFSPLDAQRIRYGKTRPYLCTRALICHWANEGYITVEAIKRGRVRLCKLKDMPEHDDGQAAFYDRGVYVRERLIFDYVFGDNTEVEVSIYRALIPPIQAREINAKFAVREDEGVYGHAHYTLKIIAQALSVLPELIMLVWGTLSVGAIYIFFGIFIFIGLFALKYLYILNICIRLPFFAVWGGAPLVGALMSFAEKGFDPLFAMPIAAVFMILGTFVIMQFCDVHEKANIKKYGILVGLKRYLKRVEPSALTDADHAAFLPFMYATHTAWLYRRKFKHCGAPAWYKDDRGLV